MRGEGQLVDRWMSRRHDVQQQLRFCIVGRASPVSVDASTRRANKVHTVKWAAWGGNSRCNLSHGNIFNAEVHRPLLLLGFLSLRELRRSQPLSDLCAASNTSAQHACLHL